MAARKKASGQKKGARKTKPARARAGSMRRTTRKKGASRKKAASRARKGAAAKSARKRSARKKAPARKRTARKKVGARKRTAAPGKKGKPAKKAARKKVAAKKTGASMEALARRIVRAASDTSKIHELYAENCTSLEPGMPAPAVGHAGIDEKLRQWEGMQKGTRWKARNTFVKGNAIAIEWTADVTLRSGQNVTLNEVAVHEIKGGKIVAERYYYDPRAFGGEPAEAPSAPAPQAASESRPSPVVASEPERTPRAWEAESISSPATSESESGDDEEPELDPFDL